MKAIMKFLGVGAFTFVVSMLILGVNGMAYVDPTVMTYVIQAVAGIAILLGAGIGFYIRKAKKKIQDKLGIEDKKEVESDDIVIKNDND